MSYKKALFSTDKRPKIRKSRPKPAPIPYFPTSPVHFYPTVMVVGPAACKAEGTWLLLAPDVPIKTVDQKAERPAGQNYAVFERLHRFEILGIRVPKSLTSR
jgi:hypothetical protein